jgi:hypothetical protein
VVFGENRSSRARGDARSNLEGPGISRGAEFLPLLPKISDPFYPYLSLTVCDGCEGLFSVFL